MSEIIMYMFEGDIARHVDCGVDFLKQNRFEEAIIEFDAALKLDPNEPYARWDRALALLSLGDYINGMPEHESAWALYDWRSLGPVKGNVDRILELPLWHGEHGCKLIVYHEMGFGDAIMLLRFLPELAKRCSCVTLVVRNELVRLFQGYGVTVVDTIPLDVSAFDFRVTFFNTVHTMGHTLESIPNAPYIETEFKFSGGRMGITWSGNSRKELDFETFLSMLDHDGYCLQSLQDPMHVHQGVEVLTSLDFLDTVKLLSTLDHVVTVDTAVAHLAGAMGHPSTHLILPFSRDWRWWFNDVWYPTINIYPQEVSGDWTTPFANLNAVLKGK